METLLNKIGQLNNTATSNYNLILERVLKTITEMLKDRGFVITNDCRTIGDIIYKMQENECILSGDGNDESIIVFFHDEERVGVKQLRTWNEKYPDSSVMIVSLEGPTAFTKKEADGNYPNVQFFTFKSLCVNITKHKLVPKHEKIDETTLDYKVSSPEEWPKLYTNDTICQYYNFKPGEIIRITRTIGVPEPIFYYRRVCIPPAS